MNIKNINIKNIKNNKMVGDSNYIKLKLIVKLKKVYFHLLLKEKCLQVK